jgi:hypothetical protein
MNVLMFHSSKLVVATVDKHHTVSGLTLGETIHSRSLEFIAGHFGSLSLSAEGNDSSTVFVGMTHNGSPSLHTIIEESVDEGDTASSGGGSSGFPISHGSNVVTMTITITTMPLPKGTPTPLTIATFPLQTIIPQPDIGLPPEQQQAYQEEQQARAHAQQTDAKRRATQWQGKLAGE